MNAIKPENNTTTLEDHLDIDDMKSRLESLPKKDLMMHFPGYKWDGLTGLLNRTYLDNVILPGIQQYAKETGKPVSIAFIDIDNFKHINDTYGHSAGDYVLKELSALLTVNIRQHTDPGYEKRAHDVVGEPARYGGEELIRFFATDGKGAKTGSDRQRSIVEMHDFNYDGHRIPVTISIGVAQYNPIEESVWDTMKRADDLLYESKKNGKNQVTGESHSQKDKMMKTVDKKPIQQYNVPMYVMPQVI